VVWLAVAACDASRLCLVPRALANALDAHCDRQHTKAQGNTSAVTLTVFIDALHATPPWPLAWCKLPGAVRNAPVLRSCTHMVSECHGS
jgi:hypothetical protein